MLSQNLIQCLINQSANPDRYLHAQSRSVLERLITEARRRPVLAAPCVESLLFGSGCVDFDNATRTETVHTLVEIWYL